LGQTVVRVWLMGWSTAERRQRRDCPKANPPRLRRPRPHAQIATHPPTWLTHWPGKITGRVINAKMNTQGGREGKARRKEGGVDGDVSFSQMTRSLYAPGDGENNDSADRHRIARWLTVHELVLWGGTPKNWLKLDRSASRKEQTAGNANPPSEATGIRNSESGNGRMDGTSTTGVFRLAPGGW